MSHPIVRVQIENSIYDRLVSTSVEYAVISFPYTINRMDLRDPISRITNIAKGKISEKLFIHFCHVNDIPIQTKKCQTPYFEPDKRDFILGREEWDIKNNFIKHDTPVLRSQDYLNLPALIPFRGDWDQWAKKNECLHRPETKSVCFFIFFYERLGGGYTFFKD